MAKAAALTVTLLTLSTFGAFGTKTAEAHMLVRNHNETNLHWANRIIQHGQTGIRWIKHHRRAYKIHNSYQQALHNHKWLLRYGKELKAKYTPKSTNLGYPPHYNEWLCIHNYEGAWNSNTGNGYYGGLQFGWNEWIRFGARYGAPIPASAASPLEQMWAAERYYKISGFSPWPNTSRMCGLS